MSSKNVSRLGTGVKIWICISIAITLWDASFVLLRPRSFPGEGDLGHFWPGYDIYRTVDYLYNDMGQHFGPSQSVLNLFEDVIYILALISSGVPQLLFAFMGLSMTLNKTLLYMAMEYFSGHNDLQTLLIYFVLPNGLWILFPTLWYEKDI